MSVYSILTPAKRKICCPNGLALFLPLHNSCTNEGPQHYNCWKYFEFFAT